MKQWVIDESKFLRPEEVKTLRKACREKAELALMRGRWQGAKDWMICDMGLSSGLRVSEIRNLKIGDLAIKNGQNSILVRNGKGSKRRVVIIDSKLKKHLKGFIEQKEKHNEGTSEDDYLLLTERRRHYSTRGLEKRFKRCLEYAGIDQTRFSIHSCRHTFAVTLLRVSKNIRMVQKQLGHSNLATTLCYADVVSDETVAAMNQIYQ